MDNDRIEDFEQHANSESINDYYAELTILHWAVVRGKHDYIKRILAYRPDVDALSKGDRMYMENIPMEGNYTPLMLAIGGGDQTAVELLLSAGADPSLEVRSTLVYRVNDEPTTGVTPLLYAVSLGNNTIVELVVEAGADINRQDEKGRTPLLLAAGLRESLTVYTLMSKGADPNQSILFRKNYTVLHYLLESIRGKPAIDHYEAVITALILGGADLTLKDGSGFTPTDYLNDELKEYFNLLFSISITHKNINNGIK